MNDPPGPGRGTAARPASVPAFLPDFAEQVLDVVESIPPGRVMSYGDIAAVIGRGGPRQVGRVMAVWGGAVPWWRVTHSDGSLLRGHEARALSHYQREGTPLRRGRDAAVAGVDMRRARWPGSPPAAPGPPRGG